MEDYVKETLIASPYPFWFTIILFAIIMALINGVVSYVIEKCKGYATKKDIVGITDKIESVKDSYNKSLESHKIELQKDFEAHRYITTICNSIDKELLRRLVKCKSEIESDLQEFYNNSDIGACQATINNLCSYLQAYNTRYGENESAQFILQLYRNIERLNAYEDYGKNQFDIPQFVSEINTMSNYINKLIAQFLPKFK